MTIDPARIRQLSVGDDLETVPVTRRVLREIAVKLEAFDRLKSHVDWRDRVNTVLRDMGGSQLS